MYHYTGQWAYEIWMTGSDGMSTHGTGNYQPKWTGIFYGHNRGSAASSVLYGSLHQLIISLKIL